jgi:hypothetical protein
MKSSYGDIQAAENIKGTGGRPADGIFLIGRAGSQTNYFIITYRNYF